MDISWAVGSKATTVKGDFEASTLDRIFVPLLTLQRILPIEICSLKLLQLCLNFSLSFSTCISAIQADSAYVDVPTFESVRIVSHWND